MTLLSHLIVLPLILPGAAKQELVWSPAPELKLSRVIETKHFLVAELQSITQQGERMISQRGFELKTTQNLKVTDTMIECDPERVTKLRRHYTTADFEAFSTVSRGNNSPIIRKLKGASALADSSVVFTWVPEDDGYGRYYDAREGAEELLPNLTVDLCMQSLLPATPVELGDKWKLEPSALRDVLAQGGQTDMELANNVGAVTYRLMRIGVGLRISQIFGEQESGEVTGQLVGLEESEDGRSLALIKLEFDVVLERNMLEFASRSLALTESVLGVEIDKAQAKLELKGSGMVRWDLTGKHLLDITDLRADERISVTLVKAREGEEGPQLESQELVMSGFLMHSVSVAEE